MENKDKVSKILIDPAGGLYYNSDVKTWIYQRPVFSGIYIDSLTIDVSIPLADMLRISDFRVYTSRLLNKVYKGYSNKWANAMGSSGQPRYRECAMEYLKTICTYEKEKEKKYIPTEIYNEGKDILEKDANARINYAKFINADMVLTIDATTYVTDHGIEAICNKAVGSESLAHYILDEIAKRTRQVIKGVSYVEEISDLKYNKLTCPAIILKIGSTADAQVSGLLMQGWFRQWISLGIYAGIIKFNKDL